MSRRARAVGFASAAAVCAGLAAGATGGDAGALPGELGPLREVAVVTRPVKAGARITPKLAAHAFEVRRVPERFAPPDALADATLAAKRRTAAALTPGGYLLESLLRTPGARAPQGPELSGGTSPVEIAVGGAGALQAAGARGRVDVVVTTEPGPGGGPGRTYVAAEGVRLLDLRAASDDAAGPLAPAGGASTATLALTRSQALRLIQAESFARSVRLIPR